MFGNFMHNLICYNSFLLLYSQYKNHKLSIKCNKSFHTLWSCYNVHVITKNTMKYSSKWHKISPLNLWSSSQSLSLNIHSSLMMLIILLKSMMISVNNKSIKPWKQEQEVCWLIWLLPLMGISLLLLKFHWLL